MKRIWVALGTITGAGALLFLLSGCVGAGCGVTRTDPAVSVCQSGLFAAYDLVVDPLHPQTVYAASNEEVVKSTDGGATWTRIDPTDSGGGAIQLDPRKPDTIYADAEGPFAFTSTDGGSSWQRLSLPRHTDFTEVDPLHPQDVYAQAGGGLFESTDLGSVWRYVTSANPDASYYAFGPHAIYASVTGRGVYVRPDTGTTWRLLGVRLKTVEGIAVSANRRVLYAGTDSGEVYRFRLGPAG